MALDSSNLHGLLGRLVQRNFDRSGLGSCLDRGHLGFTKNLRGSGSVESDIPFATSGRSPQMLCLKTQHPYP